MKNSPAGLCKKPAGENGKLEFVYLFKTQL